jgi:hypothetical protein
MKRQEIAYVTDSKKKISPASKIVLQVLAPSARHAGDTHPRQGTTRA